MPAAMRPDLFQRTSPADVSVACDIEMIPDVFESPVGDVVFPASLRREGFSLRRGAAMNDDKSDGPHGYMQL